MHVAIDAMRGALVITCLFAALFFARFWVQSRDRFFGFFTAALVLLAINWLGVLVIKPTDESRALVYVVRLLAFLLIAAGIVDKNRRPPGPPSR